MKNSTIVLLMILLLLLSWPTILYSLEEKIEEERIEEEIEIERLPKFLLIGAQKAGTTSLYQTLIRNKNICQAITKELHYFNHHYEKGINYYKSRFKSKCNNGGVSGYIDGTPDYFKYNFVPQRMNETFGLSLAEKKIVFVLREPIAREFSLFEHLWRNCAKYVYGYMQSHRSQIPGPGQSWSPHKTRNLCGENKDRMNGKYLSGHCHQINCLNRAQWININNISRNLPTFKEYYETTKINYNNSRYIHHMENYLKYFDRKQILVLSFNYLIKNAKGALKAICTHFQVPDTISNLKLPKTNEARVNVTLDCDTHYSMRKYFHHYNNQLYEYLNKRDGPSYEPVFQEFVYNSKCNNHVPPVSKNATLNISITR